VTSNNSIGAVNYTPEDLEMLFKEFSWHDSLDWRENGYCILKLDPGSTGAIEGNFYKSELIEKLLQYIDILPVLTCSFEDVPLYINSQAELTKWRLKIGK
jgi:hypothetical protein